MIKKIEISHKTVIFTVIFLLGLWFLFYVRTIIFQLLVAFLLVTMMEPLVKLLGKIKISRTLAVIITYILVIGILGGIIALIAPAVVQQTTTFVNTLPNYLSNLKADFVSENFTSNLLNIFGNISEKALNLTVSVFSNVLSVVTVLVFAFYLLLTHNTWQEQIRLSLGEQKGSRVGLLLNEIEERLGKWAGGQLILMLAVGVGIYLGLALIKVPFALPLALLAGLFEIVPILGPIAAAIPAALIGFGISPLMGIGAIAVAFLVNQLENYILVPKIMQKSAGVSPLLVLVSITVGAKLAGVMGVIIAVPFVIVLQVILGKYLGKK